MLLACLLLSFFSESTVKSQTTNPPVWHKSLFSAGTTVDDGIALLQAVAVPDYPVAEGQKVSLHCGASISPVSLRWSWQHLERLSWREVGSERNLILAEPKHSGIYRCIAWTPSSPHVSRNLTVCIVATLPTVGEILGIAAFLLSLLALIITLAILWWLWKRCGDTRAASNIEAKGFPGAEKAPKAGYPQSESEGDVYMNYTSANQAYTNLDPTNVTGDNVYQVCHEHP